MDLKTIKDKVREGAKLLLAIPTLMFKNKEEAKIVARHIVSDFDECRPDLIASKYYGDPTAVDIILKFNNISDPFSIKKGEVILVPDRETPLVRFKRMEAITEDLVKQQFVDTKRLSKKDQKRVEVLKKKYNKEDLLPPNVIPVGKKTFVIKEGAITFGAQAQNDPVVDKINRETRSASNLGNVNGAS